MGNVLVTKQSTMGVENRGNVMGKNAFSVYDHVDSISTDLS